jgi:acetyltransferase-like isoleucine patch superfamily enzyme
VCLGGGPEGKLIVGNGSWIGRNCVIDFEGGVEIGADCTLSNGVRIFTHHHGRNARSMPMRHRLKIGDGVWIAASSIILPGVTEIGSGAVIGAGAVVTTNVHAGAVIVGNPAKELAK